MLRGRLVVGIALGVMACSAAPAAADFHLMMIQEVFPGSTGAPGEDYVSLQMYSSGQNAVGGHTLTVYEADGDVADTATFPVGVPNGASQSTILIGASASVVGGTPDLVDAGIAAMDPAGGAACWAGVDCVAWGLFDPPDAGLPSPAPLIATPSGILDGLAVRRYTNRFGCESFLEAGDDTNGADDWTFAGPVPRNNATAPSEVACFDTTITKGPSGRTTDRTPTFKFKSVLGGAPEFQCAVDDPGNFEGPCASPFTLPRQSLGKHKFFVRAVNSAGAPDPTHAKRAFKVIRR